MASIYQALLHDIAARCATEHGQSVCGSSFWRFTATNKTAWQQQRPHRMDESMQTSDAQDRQQESQTLHPAEIASASVELRGAAFGPASVGGIEDEEEDDRRTEDLYRLDAEVARIPDSRKVAYLQAVDKCPELLSDEHKIAFLEREDFDAKLAADRLVNYWEATLKSMVHAHVHVFDQRDYLTPPNPHGDTKDEGGALKRTQNENTQGACKEKESSTSASANANICRASCVGPSLNNLHRVHVRNNKKPGRKSDPYMNRAVMAKLADPSMSALEALLAGGFHFPGLGDKKYAGVADKEIFDEKTVSLRQRKNQLVRRVRQLKEK